jgi:hypothetical protein
MKNFNVSIEMSNGRTHSYKIVAITQWQAIDLAYYRDGFHKMQNDRAKYKCSISKC